MTLQPGSLIRCNTMSAPSSIKIKKGSLVIGEEFTHLGMEEKWNA